LSKHVIVAIEEMKCVQDEFDLLIAKSGIKTHDIYKLKNYLYFKFNKSKRLINQ